MTDRVPGAPGQFKMTVTTDQFALLQKGQNATVTLKRDDKPITEGTPYSKAAVLPDDLALKICPDVLDPKPADAFEGLLPINSAYPVGSIYMSVSSTSPAQLFGGSWNKIEDTFLLASGTKYTAGSRGGEAEHKLTTEEMAKHFHRVYAGYQPGDAVGTDSLSYARHADATVRPGAATSQNDGNFLEYTGGDKPHNNMPPYLAVNVWQRIS